MIPVSAEALTPLFRSHLSPQAEVVSVERGPVGNGQEIWFVEVVTPAGPVPAVLRRTAPGGPLDWTDRREEYEVLAKVAAAGIPVPTPRWYEGPDSSLGGDYFVMDRVAGGPVRREDPATLHRIAVELGEYLGGLHAAGLDQDDSLSGPAATTRELRRWRDRYHADRAAPEPMIGVLLAWLERHAPRSARPPVRLWGDPGPHNLLHDGGRVTALLDWELSHVGDPLEDLGSAVWSCLGSLDPEVVITAYEATTALDVERPVVRYFEIMACATRSIMLLNAVGNYVDGTTSAPNLAGLGLHLITANLERAAALLGHDLAPTPDFAERAPAADSPRPDAAETAAGIARFLTDDVLGAVSERRTARGVKTAAALLETAALRIRIEPDVDAVRAQARSELLETLGAAGVATDGGIEPALVEVETDDRHAALRPEVWAYLISDLALRRALTTPLRRLYGG